MAQESLMDTLRQDDNFEIISEYMKDRFGMTEREYTRDNIIDSYVNNMRKFNFGNSVTTVRELSHLNRGSGATLEKRRMLANKAYNLFDSLGGAFSEGRTAGEKLDAVADYAGALILDPINVLSLGVGKIAARGGTELAKQALMGGVNEAVETTVKTLGVKAATKKGREKIAQEGRKALTKAAKENAGYKAAMNKAFATEVVASASVDTAAGLGVEAARQRALQKAEVMDDYDPTAFFFAGVGGVAGGGLAYTLGKLRGTSKLPLYSEIIERSEATVARTRREAMTEAEKVLDVAKAVDEMDNKVVKDGTVRLTDFSQRWAERVREGLDIRLANKEFDEAVYDANHDFELVRYFLLGDGSSVKGLRDILYDAGVQRWQPRGPNDRFNLYLGEIHEALDASTKKSIQDSFDSIFDNAIDGKLKGMSVEDFLKGMSSRASEAGRELALSRHLNQLDEIAGVDFEDLTNVQATNIILDPVNKSIGTYIKENSMKVQQNFIKFLVMHPGTTALNIKGWIQASSMQSFSDMIQAGLYGGTGILKHLTGDKASAVAFRNKSKQLVNLQAQKMKNLVDPYTTYEAAMDYLTFRPEARNELFRYIIGGVEVNDVMKELDLIPGEKLTESGFEKLTRKLQTLYGVKAQDFLTKTQEFMYAVDKGVRLEYDMSFNEFMAQDDVWEYLSDPASDAYRKFMKIETKAVVDALDNTFSRSFTNPAQARKGDPVAIFAGIIEETRKIPIIGAIAPFGQFFNNTLAFTAKHSGATMLYRKVAGIEQDPYEGFARMAAGWGGLGLVTMKEQKNLEEGLAWHEERQSNGQVVSRQYDFPYSHFKVLGRALAHKMRDGDVPEDLKRVIGEQIGVQGFIRNLGTQGRVLSDLGTSILDLDGTAAGDNALRLLGEAMAMYGSGFTRFADPVNQSLALAQGEDYVTLDKKQGNEAWNNTIRYVDQVFNMLGSTMTEEYNEGRQEKATATQESPAGVDIGRLVGSRAVVAPTTIEKLFNDIGRSNWRDGIDSLPEAENVVKDYIFPYLEMWADVTIERGWDELSLSDKEERLNLIISAAKKDVKRVLKRSKTDEPRKAGLIYDITESSVSKDRLKEILEAFDVREDKLWELDPPQLSLILTFIEGESTRKKRREEESGIRR